MHSSVSGWYLNQNLKENAKLKCCHTFRVIKKNKKETQKTHVEKHEAENGFEKKLLKTLIITEALKIDVCACLFTQYYYIKEFA